MLQTFTKAQFLPQGRIYAVLSWAMMLPNKALHAGGPKKLLQRGLVYGIYYLRTLEGWQWACTLTGREVP